MGANKPNVFNLRRGESQTDTSKTNIRMSGCSFVLDRDINAARNIAALAGVAPSSEETKNARGAASGKPVPNTVERRVAMNREVPLGSSPPSNERTFHKVFCASAKSLARGKRGTPPCSLRTLSPPCPLAPLPVA